MSESETNDAAMAAEVAAAVAGAPVTETPVLDENGALVEPAPPPEAWGPFINTAIRPLLFGVVVPQWQVTEEEQGEWSNALGECCDQLFPGGPAGKYACWVRLILGTGAIVGMRYATNGMKLPPLGPRLVQKTEAATVAAT